MNLHLLRLFLLRSSTKHDIQPTDDNSHSRNSIYRQRTSVYRMMTYFFYYKEKDEKNAHTIENTWLYFRVPHIVCVFGKYTKRIWFD